MERVLPTHAFHVVFTIPAELHGTLYRNGPGLFDLFGRTYNHWFDGDGCITAVRLGGGRAQGAVRITESPELRTERARQQALYGSGFTRAPAWFRNVGGQARNTASINVLTWQGRLFALSEMAPAYELDPSTLAVKGRGDLDGCGNTAFGAEQTGEVVELHTDPVVKNRSSKNGGPVRPPVESLI